MLHKRATSTLTLTHLRKDVTYKNTKTIRPLLTTFVQILKLLTIQYNTYASYKFDTVYYLQHLHYLQYNTYGTYNTILILLIIPYLYYLQ